MSSPPETQDTVSGGLRLQTSEERGVGETEVEPPLYLGLLRLHAGHPTSLTQSSSAHRSTLADRPVPYPQTIRRHYSSMTPGTRLHHLPVTRNTKKSECNLDPSACTTSSATLNRACCSCLM